MKWRQVLVSALMGLSASSFAMGGLQPSKPRVIYASTSKEASISFFNRATAPLLVQTWVDDGDDSVAAARRPAPYLVTPPIFRVEPAAGQVVRLFLATDGFPDDRERVSYLNVLYTDPVSSSEETEQAVGGSVRFSIRHRIKIFHRPKSLGAALSRSGSPLAVRASAGSGPEGAVLLVNSGPFYVSLAGKLKLVSKTDALDLVDGMIAPFETLTVPVPRRSVDPEGWERAIFSVTGDYGNIIQFEAPVER
ncbi:fimbrial biogenesis chaperone [Piscinibacter sp.]|uniref:fimbrial biogenesis chaperone n=1 Tax=Piscinibacter sp. TaxID=1903157 RepID=UPI002B63347F|nr:molecular chaperone [Albitalea sp.]HUG24708.1 molecular chaperone [Albitalea sp.]